MLTWIALFLFLPVFFGIWFGMRRSKSIASLHDKVRRDVAARLEALAPGIGGKLIDGPALLTDKGTLTQLVSGSANRVSVDATKFSVDLPGPHIVNVIPQADADAAIVVKGVRRVPMDLPYAVFSSDEAHARSAVTPALIEAIQALDRAAKVRARLMVSRSGITVVAKKGIHLPQDLRAFYDGSVAVVEVLRGGTA